MENYNVGLTPKESIELMAEKQKGDLKIVMLEKHLMAQRELYNQLKEEENESLRNQESKIAEMHNLVSEIKDYNRISEDVIKSETQKISENLFDAWQKSIKQAIEEEISNAVTKSFSEVSAIIDKQNETIETQRKSIKSLVGGYKLMIGFSYAIMFVALIVMVILPLGQFGYIELNKYFEEPSIWGGVIILSAVFVLVLAIVLVGKIKSKIKAA